MAGNAKRSAQPSSGIILATAVATSLRTLILSAALCVMVYFLADALKAFAGRTSRADLSFILSALADMKITLAATIILGGSGWIYGLGQRRLRRNTVERLSGRITTLEKRIDPRRSSSEITDRGTTRKED